MSEVVGLLPTRLTVMVWQVPEDKRRKSDRAYKPTGLVNRLDGHAFRQSSPAFSTSRPDVKPHLASEGLGHDHSGEDLCNWHGGKLF